MNNTTTIVLALVCALLAAGFFFARGKDAAGPQETFSPPSDPTLLTSQDLLDEDAKLGDAVRVEIQREGKDTLVFEKDTSTTSPLATWHMTAPLKMKVRSYEADGFGRNVNNLQYQMSYNPDNPDTVTAGDAGLDPPAGRITIEDKGGRTVAVEVGKRISKTERYVRLVGEDRICVGKTDLFQSLKSNIVEYRDQALWSFAPTDVTRIEATDRSAQGGPIEYVFVKDGDKWMMASPVSARTTDKVGEMVTAVSRLRALKWETDAKGSLAAYGLDPGATTFGITVEKQIPVETINEADGETDTDNESDEQEPPEMKIETQTYVLHISNRSPIGEDTKTYMRVGEETMVATVMKTTADKLKPVMAEWRDMRITSVSVDTASRIAIDIGGESAAFTKGADGWTFESDGGTVEASQLTELLGAVKALNAVVFVETNSGDLDQYGLASPRATIALTVPGLESPQRIAVGDYTDAKTKRLVYVRKNDATSIAKVRTSDVDAFLRKPLLYRDRQILSLDAAAISSIQLTRMEKVGGPSTAVTFERTDSKWRMSSPVDAEANSARLTELTAALANFRARTVVASGGEASAFGLHAPKVKVAISLDAGNGGETLAFAATEHDGKYYLKRFDRFAIYELKPEDYDRLTAEFRSTQLCSATPDDVTAFTIARGGDQHAFVRTDEKWTYQSEPDLPLDQQKVNNLLKQILALQAARFIRHTSGDLAEFGLDAPARKLTLSLADGGSWHLDVSSKSDKVAGLGAFFASTHAQPGVVLVSEAALNAVAVNLDDLEAR